MMIWILLKTTEAYGGERTTRVHAAYSTREDLLARVERIAKANAQYRLREVGSDSWVIGPEEDEGFFGHRLVWLDAQEVELK